MCIYIAVLQTAIGMGKKKEVENNITFTHVALLLFGRGNFGPRCTNADLATVHTRNLSTAINQ
jgi:hypothetical protein